jgi:predicted dehydrogenase/threonine dehydrogenase-like Zn-dependent dehydrogenase
MKQIVQDLKSGKTLLEDVPVPTPLNGEVLIKSHCSLVSLGTEKMLVEFGKANYLQKARSQPEKVKQVLQKIKTDGLKPTVDAVFRKLGQPLPLGYCNAGEVVAIGTDVREFQIGDPVISNGPHAEFVSIPENLVAKIPDGVVFEEAVFTVIGAIGLQGIRLVNPTFGETVAVIGLGLIGLIASQLLTANGCRVVGFEIDDEKINLAQSLGIQAYNSKKTNPISVIQNLTANVGADSVILCASNKGNDIISQAAQMSKKRGKIVLVGVVGLNINRSDFYEKELTFQVSCSYGPGRYDRNFEEKGLDYPIEYVRWTEKRNFEAVLNALKNKQLSVDPLISEIVELKDYQKIYGNLSRKKSIASIIKYNKKTDNKITTVLIQNKTFSGSEPIIGIIGAGNFTASVIAPTLVKLKANIKYIASSKGLSGTILAKKYGIQTSTSDIHTILNDADISGVVISTQHHQHATQVIESLKANKHVFVEKPLAMNKTEIAEIELAYSGSKASIMVGFNRRFSIYSNKAKSLLGENPHPINVVVTVNAGLIPSSHWTQDLLTGGGRIVGEVCHFIDLISFFTGSEITKVVMNAQGKSPARNTDNASILLKYLNGSQGVINYFSDGNKSYPKERIEIYSQGRNIVIDNFRKMTVFGFKSGNMKSSQDKGHAKQFNLWLMFLKNGGPPLIPFKSLLNTSKACISCLDSLQNQSWIEVN